MADDPATTSVVVFTRDLRTRDHPALVAAAAAERTVPLFVLDEATLTAHGSANRIHFLLDCLHDLRDRLRELGGDLVLRHGDWVDEVAALCEEVDAERVHVSDDVSGFARARLGRLEDRLPEEVELCRHQGVTVVAPGATAPSGGGPWKVFTPFHRRWSEHEWRPVLRPPSELSTPSKLNVGRIPALERLTDGETSPELPEGGETAGLAQLKAWAGRDLADYEDLHDDLAAAATSQISPYLHLGCLSPLEVATRLRGRDGGAAFVRQLCWRDFYHQLLADRPETAQRDYRDRNDHWREDPDDLEAWKQGRTGFPLVDAGMRQLRAEGFVHNRARMVVASFLTKDLYLDWRLGAAHFMDWLVDGDVANNQLNWQWTAGTGTDTNPHRNFNPTTQSKRFDPDGTYIRRYVQELADVDAPEIHEPSDETRERTGYPPPLVDHHEAIEAYKAQQATQAR
jgi:deoxyribodipyrimidine photo-lyase